MASRHAHSQQPRCIIRSILKSSLSRLENSLLVKRANVFHSGKKYIHIYIHISVCILSLWHLENYSDNPHALIAAIEFRFWVSMQLRLYAPRIRAYTLHYRSGLMRSLQAIKQ